MSTLPVGHSTKQLAEVLRETRNQSRQPLHTGPAAAASPVAGGEAGGRVAQGAWPYDHHHI